MYLIQGAIINLSRHAWAFTTGKNPNKLDIAVLDFYVNSTFPRQRKASFSSIVAFSDINNGIMSQDVYYIALVNLIYKYFFV